MVLSVIIACTCNWRRVNMEESDEQTTNLVPLRWSYSRQYRSPTVDGYFYPHEVRSVVRRQRIIEVTISLLLGAIHVLVIAGSGLSFYFFYQAQITYHSQYPDWFLSLECVLNDNAGVTTYPCALVFVSQIVAGLGAAVLLICSLLKSCCCIW